PLPVKRALFVALTQWIEGTPPPGSVVPRLADGGTTSREEVLAVLAKLPNLALPDPLAIPSTSRSHPAAEEAVGDGPVPAPDRLVAFVAAIDADGNER